MQVVQMHNAQKTPTNWLVLDGAHTAQSAAALADTVRGMFPDNPVALIIAMADDKDHKAVMAALRAVRPAVVVFTTVPIAAATQRWVAHLYISKSFPHLVVQICTGFEQDLSSDPGSVLLQLVHVQSVVAEFHSSVYETESVSSNAPAPKCADAQSAFFQS